jgi:hypothetical protein
MELVFFFFASSGHAFSKLIPEATMNLCIFFCIPRSGCAINVQVNERRRETKKYFNLKTYQTEDYGFNTHSG